MGYPITLHLQKPGSRETLAPMATEAEIQAKIDFIDSKLRELGEHFDCVQILVSWNQEAKTFNVYRGGGNWFARQGMAHSFINQDRAQDSAVELAKVLPS